MGRRRWVLPALLLAAMLCLSGCAGAVSGLWSDQYFVHGSPAGFWMGLIQGFIAPVTLLVSQFHHQLGVFEAHNNGAHYATGFAVGLALWLLGALYWRD